MTNGQLLTIDIEFIAIDDGPEGAIGARKLARENAVLQSVRVRLPIAADHQCGKLPVDGGDAFQRGGIARRELIPDAPNVFPRVVTDAIEENVVQIIGPIAAPPVFEIAHMPRFQPLQFRHRRHDAWRRRFAPALVIPDHRFTQI